MVATTSGGKVATIGTMIATIKDMVATIGTMIATIKGMVATTIGVDAYISRLRHLKLGGVSMDGIGLQGHFSRPNPPLMRAILDKLATLHLPIRLNFDTETQSIYLEEVLREGFSRTSDNGSLFHSASSGGDEEDHCKLVVLEMGNMDRSISKVMDL
ncbi:hypothetical protein FNV43_RR15362 [Rhamnella rubrinervis]|uniref:Uncharacterized protein n=1 Tax=Rhamnella rubrinervis TaxID=2594499 RepID=A0A8K0GXE1_9ROSA|nr:hypothetical protein FNV43_RR15362 [Rhamnella rubrinervis]